MIMSNASSKRSFAAFPGLKKVLSELDIRYVSKNESELFLYEPAQYRHIFWKPVTARDHTYEYRPYYVYTPAARYRLFYNESRTPQLDAEGFLFYGELVKSLIFNDVEFVASHKRGHRRPLHYVIPNGQCLGRMPRVSIKRANDFKEFLDSFWNNGWNADNGIGGMFWHRLCSIEPFIPCPSYEMFERWESLTPERVLELARV